jgi:hypothetical protein
MIKNMTLITISILLLFSCATTKSFKSYEMDKFILTGNVFPPLPDTETVDIILRAVPEYKVITIGQIRVYGIVDEDGINELKKLARSKGGNVVALAETGYTNTGFQYSLYEIARRANKK